MFTINPLLIRTDVTCVKLAELEDNVLLTGIGGQLHMFDRKSKCLRNTKQVFDGQKIYGIEPNSTFTQCLLYGGNQIKIFQCNSITFFEEIASVACNDWILTTKWINSDNNIATVFMHNTVVIWTKDLKFTKKVICEEKCILYSAYLANNTYDDLIVLSGTVFSQILIWWPKRCPKEELCPVLCRLDGHKGVIFSINYNPKIGLICSTSDDRSARLWSIHHKDLTKELLQPGIQVSLKCSMYGHSARVFRCQILDNYVLTAGEDSLVNVWNLDGKLVRKFEAHQGACVWALDCDQDDNVIATGGGDGGVTLFPLNQYLLTRELQLSNDEVPKRIGILKNGDLVAISEKGLLEYYSGNEGSWREVYRHADLISYALLEISLCRTFVALAGYHGSIHIYKQNGKGLEYLLNHQIIDKLRIFSLHWLSSESFLTCGPEGKISVWNLNGNSILFLTTLHLPPSKERWTTAACILNDKYVTVGDRKGNIYLYTLENPDPIQILKKAHNYLGITNLYFKNDELISLGRNSVVKKFYFDGAAEELSPISSDKLPFAWLAAIHDLHKDETTILLAFLGDEFVIWDCKKRRTLFQFNCGGGHRSWDFYKSDDDKSHFAYIKDKKINIIRSSWNSLQPTDIIDGYHVNEINSACCINLQGINEYLFISGGEDTTLRISTFSLDENVSFKTVNVLKSHLSSIRTIISCKISEVAKNKEKHLMFSAGGRAQIVLWELQINLDSNSDANIICREKYSYYEQLKYEESETRIMDLCSLKVSQYVVLIAACSDGTLKVFMITDVKSNYEMFALGSLFYKLKCILKVSFLEIANRHVLLSLSTDGKIAFWDLTEFVNCLKSKTESAKDFENMSKRLSSVEIFHSVQVHQSGINSFKYKILDTNRCLFVSGGDDNAIFVNLFEFVVQDDQLVIKLISTFNDVASHCAQITGIFITNKYFFTTSIDQKLNVFKWSTDGEKLNCNFVQKHNSSVADIQGMQCFERNDMIYAILYGKGIELCRVINNF